MSHRDSRIILPDGVARCEPMLGCERKHNCARYVAAMPTRGATLGDFSRTAGAMCISHVSLETARRMAGIKPLPPVRDAVDGLELF